MSSTSVRILCSLLLVYQTATCSVAEAQQPAATARTPFVLEDGTPVKLRLSQTVSSADAHVNDRVEFEVLDDVMVGDVAIIPKGGVALGTVTEAVPKRRMARGGKLEIVMDSVRLVDGQKAALRAVKEGKGGGHRNDSRNRSSGYRVLASGSPFPAYARKGYYVSKRN